MDNDDDPDKPARPGFRRFCLVDETEWAHSGDLIVIVNEVPFVGDTVEDISIRWYHHVCEQFIFLVVQMKLCALEINIKLVCNLWLEGDLALDR